MPGVGVDDTEEEDGDKDAGLEAWIGGMDPEWFASKRPSQSTSVRRRRIRPVSAHEPAEGGVQTASSNTASRSMLPSADSRGVSMGPVKSRQQQMLALRPQSKQLGILSLALHAPGPAGSAGLQGNSERRRPASARLHRETIRAKAREHSDTELRWHLDPGPGADAECGNREESSVLERDPDTRFGSIGGHTEWKDAGGGQLWESYPVGLIGCDLPYCGDDAEVQSQGPSGGDAETRPIQGARVARKALLPAKMPVKQSARREVPEKSRDLGFAKEEMNAAVEAVRAKMKERELMRSECKITALMARQSEREIRLGLAGVVRKKPPFDVAAARKEVSDMLRGGTIEEPEVFADAGFVITTRGLRYESQDASRGYSVVDIVPPVPEGGREKDKEKNSAKAQVPLSERLRAVSCCQDVAKGKPFPVGCSFPSIAVEGEGKSQRQYLIKRFKILEPPGRAKLRAALHSWHWRHTVPGILPVCGGYFVPESLECVLTFSDAYANLRELVQKLGAMPEALVASTLRTVLSTVLQLHDEIHFLHNGITTYEVHVRADGRIIIGGLGLSCPSGKGSLSSADPELDPTCFGDDATFMPPERLMGIEVSQLSDVWSIGMVAIELITGAHFFAEEADLLSQTWDDVDQHYQVFKTFRARVIMEGSPCLPGKKSRSRAAENAPSFVCQCTKKVPEERSFPRTLLKHDFITSYPSVQDADIVSWMKGKYHPISPAKSRQDCGIQSSGQKSVGEVIASSEAIRESMLACSLALPRHLKQSLHVLFGNSADEQGHVSVESLVDIFRNLGEDHSIHFIIRCLDALGFAGRSHVNFDETIFLWSNFDILPSIAPAQAQFSVLSDSSPPTSMKLWPGIVVE